MRYIKLSCPSCGANISLDDSKDFGFCSYCGTKVVQDKIIVEHKGKVTVSGIADENALLDRIFLFLEDQKWNEAKQYAERVLDIDPKNAYAYLGKMMSELRVTKIDKLKLCRYPLERNLNYAKIIRFGDSELIECIKKCNDYIIKKNEYERELIIYNQAVKSAQSANTYEKYLAIAESFSSISGFKDSSELAKEYKQKAKLCLAQNERKKKNKKIIISCSIAVAIIAIISSIIINKAIIIPNNYKKALIEFNEGHYKESAIMFEELKDYKDSPQKTIESDYFLAKQYITNRNYMEAIGLLHKTIQYKDSKQLVMKEIKNVSQRETVSASLEHITVLKNDGTVEAFGENNKGQCNVSEWKDIIAISTGNKFTVGLKKDGTVVATGYNDYGSCDVSSWSDIVAISAGDDQTVGLKADGTVVAVGGIDEDLRDVSNWDDIVAISAGGTRTVGLKSDGTVVSTVGNSFDGGHPESWDNIVQIWAGGLHTVGLKKDGTVIAEGSSQYSQCNISNWKDVQYIFTTNNTTYAVKNDGTLLCTRKDDLVKSNNKIVFVSGDADYNCIAVLMSDGIVKARYKEDFFDKEKTIHNVQIPY